MSDEKLNEEDWVMNARIAAQSLRTLAFSEINQYKKKAFLGAAESIEALGERVGEFFPDKFEQIKGVGKSTAMILKDLFDKGMNTRIEVARIELDKNNMIKHKKSGDVIRRPVEDVKDLLGRVISGLKIFNGVERVEVAGSIRRGKKFIADADLLIVVNDAKDREKIGKFFSEKGENGSYGPEQASTVLENDFQIDVNFCTTQEFGCHLLHSTGSKEHNIKMRGLAKSNGYKLNQRCVENIETGEKVFMKNEEDVFTFLGVDYVKPENRG